MAKDDLMKFPGKVVEVLPNTTYRVKFDDNDHIVLAHLSGKMRQNKIKVLAGDSVEVEVSAYDLTKGRIVFRR